MSTNISVKKAIQEAVRSGKQFTKHWAKENAFSLPEGQAWATIERAQKKLYAGLEDAYDTLLSSESEKAVNLYTDLFWNYAVTLIPDFSKDAITAPIIYMFLFGTMRFKKGEADPSVKGGFGKWCQTCLLEAGKDHESRYDVMKAKIDSVTASTKKASKSVKTVKVDADKLAKMRELVDLLANAATPELREYYRAELEKLAL